MPASTPESPRWHLDAVACVLLFALAIAVRSAGLDALLPVVPESDALLVDQTLALDAPPDEARPRAEIQGKYPLVIAELAARLYDDLERPAPPGAALEEHLAAASRPYVAVRWVVAWISALAAPLTFLLARLFVRRGPALLAGAFVAFSLLHVATSVQARPHAPLATAAALTLLLAASAARWRSPVALGGAVLAAAAATSILQSGAALGLSVAVAAVAVLRWRTGAALGALALGAVLGLALLAWAYPAVAESGLAGEDPSTRHRATYGGGQHIVLNTHRIYLDRFNGGGLTPLRIATLGHDPWLLVLAALGLVRALSAAFSSRRSQLAAGLAIAAFALPFAAVFGAYEVSFPRFFVSLVPVLAVLAAVAAARFPRLGAVGLSCAALCAGRMALVRSAPSTFERAAAALIEAPLADGSHALVVGVPSLPLAEDPSALDAASIWARSPWERYQLEHPQEPSLPLRYLSGRERFSLYRGETSAQQLAELFQSDGVGLVLAATESRDENPYQVFARDTIRGALEVPGLERLGVVPDGAREDGGTYLAHNAHPWLWIELWRRSQLGPRFELSSTGAPR